MSSTTTTRMAGLLGTAGVTALISLAIAPPASAESEVDRPSSFTSAFTVSATPDNVINPDGDPVDGEEGATGTFNYMINSDEEIICYDITLRGVTPPYESMAKTATHLHAAPAGENGPPKISFPNPEGDGDELTSSGCLEGPFTTGLEGDDGVDTGEGFKLQEVEDNFADYSSDTHTEDFVAGAVRGQLTQMPLGGVETGMGGSATDEGSPWTAAAALAALGVVGAGAVSVRRRVRA